MKKFVKSAILALGAMALLVSCFPEKNDVLVGLSASSPSFVDGKVNLNVELSASSSADVAVTLGLSGTIPASAVVLPPSAVVPAGSLSEQVPVSVDLGAVEPGNYEAVFSITSAQGAEPDASKYSCTVTLSIEAPEVPPVVSIDSYSDSFAGGKAAFVLLLDKVADEPVTVNFEVKTDGGDYATIPAEALTFSNPAVIPAGAKSLQVDVTLDESLAPAGKSYAVIAIASATGADVASSKTKTYIEFYSELQANLRTDWEVYYDGEYEREGTVYSVVRANGVGDNGLYYLFIYTEGLVDANFDTAGDYLKYMEEMFIGPNLGTENSYHIKSGDNGWLYNKFDVGNYEIWMLGCAESGHLNGDYCTGAFTIVPGEADLEAYKSWLGDWIVDGNGNVLTFTEKVAGSTFNVTGIEGRDWVVEAVFNSDHTVTFMNQDEIAHITVQGYETTVGLYGIDKTKGYFWTGDYAIATAAQSGDGVATLTGGYVGNSGGSYELGEMLFIGIADTDSNKAWSFTNDPITLPNTLSRPADQTEGYKSWLGYYAVDRVEEVYDDDYNVTGTQIVTDTWRIAADVNNVSYKIYGMESLPEEYGMVPVASYDEATGNLLLAPQFLGTWTYEGEQLADYLFGISSENQLVADGVVTGVKKSDGSAVLSASEGLVALQFFYLDSKNNAYSYSGGGYEFPTVLTPMTAPGSAPAKQSVSKVSRQPFAKRVKGATVQKGNVFAEYRDVCLSL